MRIAVKETPVYHFSELSDEAKEMVSQISRQRAMIFIIIFILRSLATKKKLC